MMDLNTIHAMSREAAAEAATEGKVPFVIDEQDLQDMPPFPFPQLGDYTPAGWEKIDTHFVDKTGMGDDDEPALTTRQFIDRLVVGHGYALTEEGQFQVYVGEYVRLSPGSGRA